MVQVLGRLAVSAGVLAVAGLSGWLASFMAREDVFLIGLIIPAISVAGVFLRGNARCADYKANAASSASTCGAVWAWGSADSLPDITFGGTVVSSRGVCAQAEGRVQGMRQVPRNGGSTSGFIQDGVTSRRWGRREMRIQ
jgi:hypothetical protein